MNQPALRTTPVYAALALLLLTTATVVVLESIKYPLAAYLKHGGGLSGVPGVVEAALGPVGYVLLLAAVVANVAVLVLELRSGALSRSLREGRGAAVALLLAALLIWFGQAYLVPGQLVTGDAPFHVSRIAHFRYGLEEGKWLYWNNDWGLGVPFLQFTGPLLFWLGGMLDLVIRDPSLTSKVILMASHLAAGWFTYLLVRSFGLARFAALVAAVAFVGAWAHGHMIVLRGGLPQALNYALLPLALLLLERLAAADSKRGRYWGGLVAVSALLLINHPSTGLYVGVFMTLFIAGNLLLGRYRWRDVVWMGTAGAAAIPLTLFMVVPIIEEQQWVTMIGTGHLLSLDVLNLERLKRLLLWSNGNTGPGGNFDAYLGLSVVLLAAVALGGLRRGANAGMIRLLAMLLVLSLLLTGPHVRTVMVVGFFVALLAGFGVQRLQQWRPSGGHWPALLLLVLLLDLGLTAIQPLARTDKDYFITAGHRQEQSGSQQRLLSSHSYDGPVTVSIFSSPLLSYRVPQTSLPHNYSANLFYNYGAVLYKRAEGELRDRGRLTPATEQQLALLDIGAIVNDNGHGYGMPGKIATEPDPIFGRVVRIHGATPVVFAARLETLTPVPNHDKPVFWSGQFEAGNRAIRQVNAFVDEVARRMAYDPATGFAQRLLVRGPLPSTASADDAAPWTVRVIDYRIRVDRVTLDIDSAHAGYVRLAHAWYPRLRATRNGVAIPLLRGSTNLVVLPIVAGDNRIELVPTRSPIRYWLGMFALGWSLLMSLVAWRVESRGRHARSAAGKHEAST